MFFCVPALPLGSYFVGVSRILWAETGGNSCESGGLQWLSWACTMFVCCVVGVSCRQPDRDGSRLSCVHTHTQSSRRGFFWWKRQWLDWTSINYFALMSFYCGPVRFKLPVIDISGVLEPTPLRMRHWSLRLPKMYNLPLQNFLYVLAAMSGSNPHE